MNLKQALLARVPLAQKRAELEKVICANRWALRQSLKYHEPGTLGYEDFVRPVLEARQAYYNAQDQLSRL